LRFGDKMSKSKNNVVPVGPFVDEWGSDTARLTILFAAPPERDFEWTEEGVAGAHRFLSRIHRICTEQVELARAALGQERLPVEEMSPPARGIYRKTHQTLRKVQEDSVAFHFNTAIAATMELYNELSRFQPADDSDRKVLGHCLVRLVQMLAPYAPHLAEEHWHRFGAGTSIMRHPWPEPDPAGLEAEQVAFVFMVNGKLRGELTVPVEEAADQATMRAQAEKHENVARYLAGKRVVKEIFVSGKLLNLVVK
jgi:leucyl-tRNA synthetase